MISKSFPKTMTENVVDFTQRRQFNLALCLPSGHLWEADFGLSVALMVLAINKKPVPGYGPAALKIQNQRASLLPRSRQQMIQRSIQAGCSHALFIDSDQSFPAYLVHRLASHDLEVVGCNIATKCVPAGPTARKRHDTWAGGSPVYSNGKMGLEKVWRLGCGIMLIKLEVFKKMPLPWFEIRYHHELDDFIGEDWFLCEQFEKAGVDIWVDHSLSLEIGHVGPYDYRHGLVVPAVEDNGDNYVHINRPIK
jgi:hypothetical protein